MNKETKVIFERSVPGRKGVTLPPTDVPDIKLSDKIPDNLIRKERANLPELSEPDVVRHFVNLSVKNHHVDRDFYPLGSCTMKYNPKINDAMASLPGFIGLHPDQSESSVQGALQLMYELEQLLIKTTGLNAVTLQPSAGSQGEFVGILMMKKYHMDNNEDRKYIIIPETAHGTNPASVILGGFKTRKVKSDDRGRVDIEDLKNNLDKDVGGMMLTQPNTLGLFEDNILQITKMVHDVGGLMYMDGANLNALIGISLPGKMGFDIAHINLHKTFSTPHGGGGPGAGPIAVVEKLKKYLPFPLISKSDDGIYSLNYDIPNSIGPIHSYFGNFGILVRAYVYIRTLGESGLKSMTRNAILNANYLKSKLSENFDIPFPEGTMHEFVASGVKQKSRGVKVIDIAKALLDYGYHAPTIYFPNNIPEAMMIEPTESESKETLDDFIHALLEIDQRIDSHPDEILRAPINTPVGRLDETKANREPNLRWTNEI